MPAPYGRDHATPQQLSDLLEGLLPPAEDATLTTHLGGCERCRGVRDQLNDLPAVLASVSIPPMPTAVAARLDDALAAESQRRAESSGTSPVVVPLDSARRPARNDRARRWFAGVAAAAAAVVGVSVAGNVWTQGGGGADSSGAATSDAGGNDDAGAGAEAGAAGPTDRRATVPDVALDSFAADVRPLYDERAGDFVQLRGGDQARRCSADDLRAETVTGDVGPLVLVDRAELARLVATGPARPRTITAYSCASGEKIASARLRR